MSLEQSSATTDEASTQQISAEGVAAPAAEPAAVNPVVASDGHRRKTVLAIDAMGGDFGPSVIVAGAVDAARTLDARLLLVGREDDINAELAKYDTNGLDLAIVQASEVALMSEKPSEILRRKKDASIQVACHLVKEGAADGVISAGHSGATVACGMFIMGRVPGVERPALASVLPTEKNPTILLDVGATVDCKPYHLFQFGLMGEAFSRDLLDCESPRVGLLSIGEEEGKGNLQVKEAYDLLKMVESLNFVGNVEGRDLFNGNVDVTVCDGFMGNVALKLSEGLGSALCRILKRELLHAGLMSKMGAYMSRPAFRNFAKIVDYAEYGGALLLGLRGIAIVCHGASNAKAICSATRMAAMFVEKKTNERLMQAISENEELTRYGRSC